MIRVVLVDDEARLRKAWERLFGAREDMELVASLPDTRTLDAVVSEHSPHVVVVDLSVPGEDPIESIRRLRETHPGVRAVVFTGHSDGQFVRAAFDAGAWGYVDKLAEPGELFDAVRRVADGETVFPPMSGGVG